MAQNEPLPQNIRGEIVPSEIRRNLVQPQLEIYAKPTDPMVAQGKDGQTLVNALSAINPALAAYGQMQAAQKPDNEAQAHADAVNDQATGMDMSKMSMENTDGDAQAHRPSGFFNTGAGYQDAYDQMNGKLYAANDYKQAVWQYYQDNRSLSPQEFADGLKKDVLPQFLSSLNPHQMAGFLPEAMATEDSVLKANLETNLKDQQEQKLATVASSNRIDIEGALQKVLGIHSPDQLLDPKVRQQYMQNRDNHLNPGGVSPSEALAQNIYSLYRNSMGNAKAMGLTTSQFSSSFLDTVSDMAKRYGMPELLQYAYKTYQPTDDEKAKGVVPDNIAVADAFGDKVQSDILQATHVQDKMEAGFASDQAAAAKQANDNYMQDTRQKIFGLMLGNGATRGTSLTQLWSDINTNKSKYGVTDTQYNELNTMIEKGMKQGSFANADSSNVVSQLYAKTIHLTSSDVNAAAPYLTESRYVALMNKVDQYQLSAANDAKAEQHWAEHKGTEETLSAILKKYVVQGTMGQILNPGGKETQYAVQNQLGTWMAGQQHVTAQTLNDYFTKVVAPHNPVPATLFSEGAGGVLLPVGGSQATPTAAPTPPVTHGRGSASPTQAAPSVPAGAKLGKWKDGSQAYAVGGVVYNMKGQRLN